MPSEEIWDTMGYTELNGHSIRRHFPVSPLTVGLAGGELDMQPDPPVTVSPVDPGVSPTMGDAGLALPWRDMRDGYAPAGLEQITTADGRYYLRDGKRYPSITTILDRMGDKSALDAWRARVGEEEAERVRQHAAIVGDAVHSRMEGYALTAEWDDPDPLSEGAISIREHMGRLTRAFSAHVEEVYAVEARLLSTVLGAAGTVDLVCKWDGKLAIVDYKTKGKPMHPLALDRYYMQAAFYSVCWKEMHGHTPNRLVVLESATGEAEAAIHVDSLYPHRVKGINGEIDGFFPALHRAREECRTW